MEEIVGVASGVLEADTEDVTVSTTSTTSVDDVGAAELEPPAIPGVAFLGTSAVQISWQDAVEKSLGTLSQNRSSPSAQTANPGSLASACVMRCQRKSAACALMVNAWTWNTTCTRQWRTEKMK